MRLDDAGRTVAGLVLLAPALGLSEPPVAGVTLRAVAPTVILHAVEDEVVSIDVSRRFAAANAGVELHEVSDDHPLSGSRDKLVEIVRTAVARICGF